MRSLSGSVISQVSDVCEIELMKFSEIVTALGDEVTGSSLAAAGSQDGARELTALAAVQDATNEALSYVEGSKFAEHIATTQAGALVLASDEALQEKAKARGIPWVSVKHPRLVFARAIALFYQPFQLPPGIHPTAVIDPTATIGKDAAIGAHVVIQGNVAIGDRTCIHPNVVVYPEVSIGNDTVLHANCVIHERTQIGTNCVIHSGAAIGSEGFGFVPTETGWEKMHQSGCTIIEDGVEIGCNSAVDRPAVGETRVGRNAKIDNMVHIAHGCKVGEAGAMAAQVGLAGGVTVGNRVILAGQVGIANQAVIGDGATATAQAGIHSHVKPGMTVSGTPSIPHNIYLRSATLFKKLPEMAKAIRQLQKKADIDQ